ncbi:DUF1120 domain-containing protein [Herbaspirillum lusitanum]|jgi:hypothetical protein|uniref:DUF1120 domain-containing protein n=1 Tax=Herbaspirillum lusitanum TaxID=213312 RepID=A0ABW9A657_9BURK
MKKITLLSTVAATAFAMFTCAAYAADTAELKVKGVIKPAACTPSFSGGGVIDYGVIPASSLKADAYTTLPTKEVNLSITCDAAVKVAFKAKDNRANSVVSGIVSEAEANFGLGTVAGKNVGGYIINISRASTVDGAAANNIYSLDSGKSWSNGAGNVWNNGALFGFSTGSQPMSTKQLNAKLNVTTVLNKPANLPLTQEVPLDGSATFEVIYL